MSTAPKTYKGMHRVWEPLCLEQAMELVTVDDVQTSPVDFNAVASWHDRGYTTREVLAVIVRVCHTTDRLILGVMSGSKR